MFGYKNHVAIDREHSFVPRYRITHAAAHDGGLGAVLDRDNTASEAWADTAYRSAANLSLLKRCGLRPQFDRKKPRCEKMPAHSPAAMPPAPLCSRVAHVFAA
jgi:transposase, IS5 family